MMAQYQVEALRTIRAIQCSHEKAGHTFFAEQMRKVGDQVEAMQAENEQLRAIISEATAAVGNGSCCSTQASIEFMAGLPKEIALNSAALRAELAALKDAARSVVKWARQQVHGITLAGWNSPEAVGTVFLTPQHLDALAALVGEE